MLGSYFTPLTCLTLAPVPATNQFPRNSEETGVGIMDVDEKKSREKLTRSSVKTANVKICPMGPIVLPVSSLKDPRCELTMFTSCYKRPAKDSMTFGAFPAGA